jgi:hypothetical protein
MPLMHEALLNFFAQANWECFPVEGQTAVRLGFSGDNGSWPCVARVREDEHQFLFYSIYPSNTPEPHRPAMLELVARANYGLVTGNFEIDLDDGEVRYKTSVSDTGGRFDAAHVKHLITVNLGMMDQYFPAITAVMEGKSAREALAQVET